jgi:D-arabinose 1-dehydrogenase-like Zn-dependent alcohol dehydrogenase
VKPGEFVTILGAAGGLGHLAVQYGVAMGMRVVAVDVGQDKLDFCTSLGAEAAFDATDKELVRWRCGTALTLWNGLTGRCGEVWVMASRQRCG